MALILHEAKPRPSYWLSVANSRITELDTFVQENKNNAEKAEVRRQLEVELAHLSRITTELNMRHNALLPLFCLPAELLCLIFLECSVEDTPHARLRHKAQSQSRAASLGWIRITHVCRLWRQTALQCPSLWVEVVCSLPAATEEILRRSTPVPITISYDFALYKDSRAETAVALALESASARVKAIKIISERMELSLASTTFHPMVTAYTPYPLSHDLHACKAPSLRSLILYDCSISWSSPIIRGLSRLEIVLRAFAVLDILLPTLDQLLSALKEMQGLQVFCLSNCLPRSPSSTLFEDVVVPLPNLILFRIHGKAECCSALLRRLHIPLTARVQLWFSSTNGDDYVELFSAVARFVHGQDGSRALQGLSFETHGSSLHVECWVPSSSPTLHDMDVEVSELFMRGRQHAVGMYFGILYFSAAEITRVLSSMCDRLQVQEVQFLSLGMEGCLCAQQWQQCLGQLKNVQKLCLSRCLPSSFMDALTLQQTVPLDVTSRHLLFPKLDTIWFNGIDFGKQIKEASLLWDYCLGRLKQCAESANRLRCLRFDRCGLDGSLVALFDGIASVVEWDGSG
ncbi:hypothetical protein EW146_g6317 [Bondarzewia mesenterica]|uniref:Uncharacterized protein n=1 Tax=Bondarzewia mesenterica TaxID=1095465 RepID=A0A4S4LNY1_9AGAM|nr:hypothetical protein EW146_g6317 [Bondarzewia mesenterica]